MHFLNNFTTGFEKFIDIKEDPENKDMNDKDIVFEDEDNNEEEDKMEEDETEEDKVNIANRPMDNKQTEALQNNPAYRAWLVKAKSTVGVLNMLEKFCQFGD